MTYYNYCPSFFPPVRDPFNFLTQSYNMIPFSDYEQQQLLSNRIRNIGINATRRIICYDQPIYNDMRLEVSEYFGMTLTVQGMPPTTVLTEVRPMYDQVTILIVDDDGEKFYMSLLYKLHILIIEHVYMCLCIYFRGCGGSGEDILQCFRGCGCGRGVCYCVQPQHRLPN